MLPIGNILHVDTLCHHCLLQQATCPGVCNMSSTFSRPRSASIRINAGGWAAAGPETIRNIIERMGAHDVCVAYGLSEASPNVVLNDYRDPVELRIAGLAKPHDGVEVRITERDTGAVLPDGRWPAVTLVRAPVVVLAART